MTLTRKIPKVQQNREPNPFQIGMHEYIFMYMHSSKHTLTSAYSHCYFLFSENIHTKDINGQLDFLLVVFQTSPVVISLPINISLQASIKT